MWHIILLVFLSIIIASDAISNLQSGSETIRKGSLEYPAAGMIGASIGLVARITVIYLIWQTL